MKKTLKKPEKSYSNVKVQAYGTETTNSGCMNCNSGCNNCGCRPGGCT